MNPIIINFFLFVFLFSILIIYKIIPALLSLLKESRDKVLLLKNKRLDFLKEEEKILKEKENMHSRFLAREEEESRITKKFKESLDKKIRDYDSFLKKDLEERLFFLEKNQEKVFLQVLKEKILEKVFLKIEQKQDLFSKKMVTVYDQFKKNL